MRKLFLLNLIALVVFLSSCSCGSSKKYEETPVDKLIKQMQSEKSYNIILQDMDLDDGFFSDKYRHKYKILVNKDDSIVTKTTDWIDISKAFFWKNENNLGMELASKDENGKVTKVPAPPGYNNYVGNTRYGSWNGGMWMFYPSYMYMSPMFGYGSRPVYQRNYRTYSSVYRGSRPYYGSSVTSPQYGTSSSYTKSSRSDFFQRRASKSGWSSSSSRAAASRSSARGTSRYNSSSSYRSSGGGYGK